MTAVSYPGCLVASALAVVAILFVAGCNGGTVDRHALTNDAATVDSIACEGALLARLVTRDDSAHLFTRVHADELRLQASNLADALSQRATVDRIKQRVRAEGRRAARVARELELLHRNPNDHQVSAAVAQRLEAIGRCP